MSKLILVSFADTRYRNSLKRLETQTRNFPFDERFFLTQENSLTRDYWRKLKPWLYRRGYGYWVWKYSIIKEIFKVLSYGDILFYSDAGLTWNDSKIAINRFNEYIDCLKNENDILVFEYPEEERIWTKGDILDAIGVYNDDTVYLSNQISGGFFGLKKTRRTECIIQKMVELCDIQKELVTDKRSKIPNKEGFVENRHDQSIFSVLVKTYPHVTIPYNKTYEVDELGVPNKECPIQNTRQKENERPIVVVLRNKFLMPWRFFLNIYFRWYRDYVFMSKGYPW